MPTPTWLQLESALTAVVRAYGYLVDQHFNSGDKIAHEILIHPGDDTIDDLNLTELAKDLERELAT